MPRVSQDHLDARRRQILDGSRACFARFGYEGATVRRLEDATGLSRGAIFHHFRDKESLFLAVAEDDAAAMVETVARNGLVQVMRDLLDRAGGSEGDTAGWLGTQLEVSRRLRTDPAFAKRWSERAAAVPDAPPGRQRRAPDRGGGRRPPLCPAARRCVARPSGRAATPSRRRPGPRWQDRGHGS